MYAENASAAFARAQSDYAAHGIATFPVGPNKRPAIRGYNKIGLKGSAELARKFVNADAIGFMCGERTGITVLDVDTNDENVLADAIGRHGQTPIVIRTASGKFHAYYKHAGEHRQIRPWPGLAIDLLGTGGFVVAPPATPRPAVTKSSRVTWRCSTACQSCAARLRTAGAGGYRRNQPVARNARAPWPQQSFVSSDRPSCQ